jgi:S-adenosylmethionine synthetase
MSANIKLLLLAGVVYDATPKGIIETLDLQRPIYAKTAAYGHFGRTDIDLPWEAIRPLTA